MAKIIVIQHVAYEILGIMNPLLKHQGVRIKYINFGRHPDKKPNIQGYDGMIILGGPMNVDEVDKYPHLITEVDMIRAAMEVDMPVLGICLGAQLIAKANAAMVSKNTVKEIGWYPMRITQEGANDPIFQHFSAVEQIFQWHGDTFAVPTNATLMAENSTCKNQAFRIGHNVYGFQFHLEVDQGVIQRWLNTPAMQKELSETHDELAIKKLRADTVKYLGRSQELGLRVFNEFIQLIGHKPGSKTLLSS